MDIDVVVLLLGLFSVIVEFTRKVSESEERREQKER